LRDSLDRLDSLVVRAVRIVRSEPHQLDDVTQEIQVFGASDHPGISTAIFGQDFVTGQPDPPRTWPSPGPHNAVAAPS